MRVFKLYFKILKKSIPNLLIYIGILVLFTIMLTINFKSSSDNTFTDIKVRTALINHDKDSLLLKEFKNYLEKSSDFIEIDNTKKSMQDALFFRNVSYIISIPEGFTEDFLDGKDPIINKYTLPDSSTNHKVDLAINNFLNTGRVYINNLENISEGELVKVISKDLDVNIDGVLYSKEGNGVDNTPMVTYYNYLVYAILSILILGVSDIMISFTNIDIKRRNLASPISPYSMQIQQIFGHLAFTLLCVILFIFFGSVVYRTSPFNKTSILFILNLISFAFAALSIAYLVGSLTKSRDITNGISNVVGLGLSFISGVFVPMEFLGETTLQIARFTPAYWYTTANIAIGNLSNFDFSQTSSIYGNMLIQLGFAIAIIGIALVVNKKKSREIV